MQALSMVAQTPNPANPTVGLSQKLNKLIAGDSLDYNSWRSLILEIETEAPEDINFISVAYDSFLSTFPLCHWHLEKYAHHKAKLCNPQEAVNIYERGVGMAMFSVGFWVDYFTFGAASFENPEDVRRLFRRAVSFVDKDYFCHAIWDKYMKYEFDLEGWSFLAHSYIQALQFPTKKLRFYYDNFKQFVANLEEEIGYENNNGIIEQVSIPCAAKEISMDEIYVVIKDLLDSTDKSIKFKALGRYRSIGEEFYREARQMDEKIICFEKRIRRHYFYATPLDDDQLDIWHLYLDFIEKQDNVDWAMKLYERCLIPCANYPEFWMRYVDFLEAKGGRELAISVVNRATQIFLKNVPEIHLFSARFKEHIGDVSGARAALVQCDTKTDSSFIENVVTLANLERRRGKFSAASATYKKALKTARKKRKRHVLPHLYFHFAQLTFLTTGSAAAARDVLIEGVRGVPHCRFLLEELIKFAMTHEGASQLNIIDPIIGDAISTGLDEYGGLSARDRENISHLFLEFVNLCGTIHDIRKSWNRHIKLFPQSLRNNTTCNHPTSYSKDSEKDKKGLKKLPPLKDHGNNGKAVILSNEDASQDDRTADELSCQSKEHKRGSTVVSFELVNQDRPKQTGVSAGLSAHSKESTLIPRESAREIRKLTETMETIEPSVSLDNISIHTHGNESQEPGSMSCEEYKTKTDVLVNLNSYSGPSSKRTSINIENDVVEIEHALAQSSCQRESQLGDIQEDKEDKNLPMTISQGLPPPASNQSTPLTSQPPSQTEDTSQMLYHYHQQQLLHHQYQQQLHMQSAYSQMQYNYYDQPAYQMQPHQQHYGQQSVPSYQHPQQNDQQIQLAHDNQYHHSQDLAYQAYHLAYHQQGQQMLLQQYQQYQGYQPLPHQQQPKEGPYLIEEQQNSTQNLSQNQQGLQCSKKAPLEYDATAESSESPHLH
ncbi:hypothetical protein OROMI_023763 [Orobanche minor]